MLLSLLKPKWSPIQQEIYGHKAPFPAFPFLIFPHLTSMHHPGSPESRTELRSVTVQGDPEVSSLEDCVVRMLCLYGDQGLAGRREHSGNGTDPQGQPAELRGSPGWTTKEGLDTVSSARGLRLSLQPALREARVRVVCEGMRLCHPSAGRPLLPFPHAS